MHTIPGREISSLSGNGAEEKKMELTAFVKFFNFRAWVHKPNFCPSQIKISIVHISLLTAISRSCTLAEFWWHVVDSEYGKNLRIEFPSKLLGPRITNLLYLSLDENSRSDGFETCSPRAMMITFIFMNLSIKLLGDNKTRVGTLNFVMRHV